MPVVVVFPFVPVTATYGASHTRAPTSISPHTGSPRARAQPRTGARSGTPGPATTRVASARCPGSCPPGRSGTPRSWSRVAASPKTRSVASSLTVTSAPSATMTSATATPATPAPTTTTRSPANRPVNPAHLAR